jgi:hypothetical protein
VGASELICPLAPLSLQRTEVQKGDDDEKPYFRWARGCAARHRRAGTASGSAVLVERLCLALLASTCVVVASALLPPLCLELAPPSLLSLLTNNLRAAGITDAPPADPPPPVLCQDFRSHGRGPHPRVRAKGGPRTGSGAGVRACPEEGRGGVGKRSRIPHPGFISGAGSHPASPPPGDPRGEGELRRASARSLNHRGGRFSSRADP